MIHVAELRTATSFVVFVDKSREALNAKITAVRGLMGDTIQISARGVVDSDDLGHAFDKIGFNDWDKGND